MSDNSFNEVVNSMMQGMESFLSSKTVVGQPTQAGDTTIIPLVDVTFGVGAGASSQEKKNGGAGGMTERCRQVPCWLSKTDRYGLSISRTRIQSTKL